MTKRCLFIASAAIRKKTTKSFSVQELAKMMKIQQQDDGFYLGELVDDFEDTNQIGALSKYPDWETDTAQYFGLRDMYQHNIRR